MPLRQLTHAGDESIAGALMEALRDQLLTEAYRHAKPLSGRTAPGPS